MTWASTVPLTVMSDTALDIRMMLMTLVAMDGKTRPDAAAREAAAQETADEIIRRQGERTCPATSNT